MRTAAHTLRPVLPRRYAYEYVHACNANGIACCTTVVVADPATQQPLFTKQVHTSNSTTAGGSTGGPQPTPSPVEPPTGPAGNGTEAGSSSSGGVSAGAVAGAVVGVLAALACAAGLFVWLRRRRKQQVAASAATAARAATDPKLSGGSGLPSSRGTGAGTALSGLDEEDAAAAAALATVPTKPDGSTPASLASLLQALDRMEGGGAAYSGSAEDAYLLSYVTSLVSELHSWGSLDGEAGGVSAENGSCLPTSPAW